MTHKISRRSFLQASGVLAAMTSLSACSTGGDDSAASNSSGQSDKIRITFYA